MSGFMKTVSMKNTFFSQTQFDFTTPKGIKEQEKENKRGEKERLTCL